MRVVSLVVLVMALALSGCADRCYYSRDQVQRDTVEGLHLESVAESVPQGVRVTVRKVYTADVVHKESYSQSNPVTILAAAAVTLGSLGAIETDREEASAPERRTMDEPLDRGAPVSGRLRILDPDTERTLLVRSLACNVADSGFVINVPRELPRCRVVFEGLVRVMGENLPLYVESLWVRE